MTPEEHIDAAMRVVTARTAIELATAYTDDAVFPMSIEIDLPSADSTHFPGWDGAVLVLAHENQGVCSFGLSLDGPHAGAVAVGGDLEQGVGTTVYVAGLDQFVLSRRWDARCLNGERLLQAQAEALDERSLTYLRERFTERVRTTGWPCHTNLRFEGDDIMVMLWSCDGQCDWWITGSEERLRRELPRLRRFSDLDASLWANDELGIQILESVTGRNHRT